MASQTSPPPSPPSSASSASPPTNIAKTTTMSSQPQSFCIDALLRPSAASPGSASSPPSSPASSPNYRTASMLQSSMFNTGPGGLYPYPGGLLGAASGGPPTSSAASSLESVLKNGMNMQTVQLEWLARTGMLYHRFPELAGNLSRKCALKISYRIV